jgi:carboxyl-terminal processing protease
MVPTKVMRTGALLFLLLIAPAHAQTVAATGGFDPHLVTNVYATALAFMAPRTLEPVAVSQLTIWGLHGLTALDPDLSAGLHDGQLRLTSRDRLLGTRPPPADNDINGWATAAAELAAAAVVASYPVRRAGTQGVVQSFFDELFNHLDPYSRYVPPIEAGEDRARRSGSAGAGVTLIAEGGAILVQRIVSDGPAAAAGIHARDAIVAVNGQSTRGVDVDTVAGWIAGPEDTRVAVTVRSREGRVRTVDVMRSMVPPDTVFAERLRDALLIRVTEFDRATATQMMRLLSGGLGGGLGGSGAIARPVGGIILDLRGNPGGLVREAVGVADELLQAGIIASAVGRDPDATRVWRSVDGELADDLPVVVMVDGRTASAAEILTAALADRGRAVVVGSATLGKGLVQTIAPLPDGGELFVTWSRVLAPRGWPLQGLGVLPQVCTSLGQNVVQSELDSLDQGTQPMAEAIARHRAARAPLPPAQAVAIRAACPAAVGSDADVAAARYLIQHPAAYATALLPPMRDYGGRENGGTSLGVR